MLKIYAQLLIAIVAIFRGYSRKNIEFLLAQSNLETGNFTSKYWYTDKNLFGMSEMTNPDRRRRLAGVRLGSDGLMRAQFRSLLGSVLDRLDWDKQNDINKDYYKKEVSKIYHTSPTYGDSVSARIDNTIQNIVLVAYIIVPVILLLVIKLIFK